MGTLIFIMSLSGSAIVIIYNLIVIFGKRKYKECQKRSILHMSILFFLLPISLLKYLILGLMKSEFGIAVPEHFIGDRILNNKLVIFMDNTQIIYSKYEFLFSAFTTMCALAATFIIIIEIVKLIHIKKNIYKNAYPASTIECQYLEQIKSRCKVARKVQLVKSNNILYPLTTGIIRPIILLPETIQVGNSETDGILAHELFHIKNWDVLFHFLTLLVVAFHWFNPFSYLLYHELSDINEFCSDEMTVESCNKEEKLRYCHMMINSSENTQIHNPIFGAQYFLGYKNQIQRRIKTIMETKKQNKLIAFITGCTSLLVAIGIAFLYQPPLVIYAGEKNSEYTSSDFEEFTESVDIERMPYEDNFITKNMQIYEILDENPHVICKHNYIDGTRKKHSKKSNGGCETKYYEARSCTLCGRIETGKLYRTDKYEVCPH